MSRPPPSLIDLVAGRRVVPTPGLVASALEHRLGGQLLAMVDAGHMELSTADHRRLTAADLATIDFHRQLWSALASALDAIGELGIEAIAIKGVAEEARLYGPLGQRPCADIDLVIASHHVDRIDEILERLDPVQPDIAVITDLVRRRQLQHVHLVWEGVALDLHLDVLKLGIWTRHNDIVVATATTVQGPDGGSIPVVAPEVALIVFLTHLNKDRFSYLGAYGDVARAVRDPDLDWDLVHRFVDGEGLAVPVWKSLGAVAEDLAVDIDVPPVKGWRGRAWDRLWPAEVRLCGHDGRSDHRQRQWWIPVLASGRGAELGPELRRRALPSKALLDYHKPELRGHSRLRRLTLDRC